MKEIIFTLGIIVNTLVASAQLRVGAMAPGISLPDTKDSIVSLSSLKGKVVLIDFWASWCMPCRAANPAVVRLYKKYKEKGFEVFAVSIDTKKEAWIRAIRQDKLTYTQVNENAGWYSKVAEQYFVEQIPTSFLLDRSGKIVAVDLEGNSLENKIKNLLK
ncbi:MAG TPA: TlpA disulfide reductase family protein [Ferruginibacter sp.]|nr:TlpA disulfide reductase family protein [Ferruginibacter sp.]